MFWVIVHGIADGAFKGLETIEKLLSTKPPSGRESLTLEWTEEAEKLPFFRAVTNEGPSPHKALSFSSLHYNNTSLAKRDGFKDPLRVHGIRGGVANMIDREGPFLIIPLSLLSIHSEGNRGHPWPGTRPSEP